MSEIRERITGTEMEWSLSTPGALPSSEERDARDNGYGSIFKHYVPTLSHVGKDNNNNYYLGNGARFYMDVGNHPEYATPEDAYFLGTAANEIAGERIMVNSTKKANRPNNEYLLSLPEYGLHKRLIDDNGITWGNHENYCASADLRPPTSDKERTQKILGLLGVHMATRSIFFGAGVLLANGQYLLSQKSLTTHKDFEHGTTGTSKPLVNLRDEPHAESNKFYRVHVVSGDANMSPWAVRMKLGTTSLVLRLMEAGIEVPELQPSKPLNLITRQVASDLSTQNHYPMEHGKSLTALEIQQRLVREVGRLAARVSLPEEELWTLEEWQRACYDLQYGPHGLADRADWAAKFALLRGVHDRRGLSWESPELRGIDRHWDRIDIRGAGIAFRESTFSEWMPPEELIVERMSQPPVYTRARLRGKFVQAFSGNANASVDWMTLKMAPQTFSIKDPYASYDSQVDDFIARVA